METINYDIVIGLILTIIIALLVFTPIIPSIFEWIKRKFPKWWKNNICDELNKDDNDF